MTARVPQHLPPGASQNAPLGAAVACLLAVVVVLGGLLAWGLASGGRLAPAPATAVVETASSSE
ncbi:hypothetical protein [Pauljensenia hongkongensis]|jgi:lipoprotein|uniref:Uncharacterized protein n=1 Tax=Pauljensenia hongkongensis TaxID=178339 RepID=A0A1D8B2H7_9ACTO|nr:hypothetical protein [Pauljensenia hongkongensis]EFW09943.1 hypothetical protein HMPREF9005_1078 [Actinomyces sp. oral taxon 178 str. F0338]ERH33822.1 hypothetical protein HMPREF1550_00106 [Actinomyces sp. oral taxon 877 str. F0543]RKV64315.1 MAG: hypothetical protein D8B55_07220 [Actinomyces sp.]WLD79881.1 hypothetical protein QU668_10145 [Schaalia sp. HMT-877]AOS47319.1 hypothetical protein BH719_05110 [Pauljensenia hongkongensis]